jgi:hypothetical protein
MAITRVTASYHHTVGPKPESFHNPFGVDSGAAHSSYNAKIGFNLVSAYAGQITTGIRTPVTTKNNDFGFERIPHSYT